MNRPRVADECRKTPPERTEIRDMARLARWWKVIVFDGDGRLRDVHEKFPVDLGHRKMMDEES
jgi:hypothetical protein